MLNDCIILPSLSLVTIVCIINMKYNTIVDSCVKLILQIFTTAVWDNYYYCSVAVDCDCFSFRMSICKNSCHLFERN